uniref:Ovule protein n=1 Tax=Haemonchus placei TaxID=6290 RepID=A0A0N4W1Q1_HAEPC
LQWRHNIIQQHLSQITRISAILLSPCFQGSLQRKRTARMRLALHRPSDVATLPLLCIYVLLARFSCCDYNLFLVKTFSEKFSLNLFPFSLIIVHFFLE